MYSQSTEEKHILQYFRENYPDLIKGAFLDLAANDGITFSNTYALSQMGWGGCCIEPSPKAFQKLQEIHKDREDIELINLAITEDGGELTFMESGELIGNGDVGLVSTFKGSEVERFYHTVKYEEITVNSIQWEQFYEMSHYKVFDMVSLDIEGCELEVLPYMDFDKMETKMLVIEHNGREDLKREYEKYLDGFSLIHTTPENLLYAR